MYAQQLAGLGKTPKFLKKLDRAVRKVTKKPMAKFDKVFRKISPSANHRYKKAQLKKQRDRVSAELEAVRRQRATADTPALAAREQQLVDEMNRVAKKLKKAKKVEIAAGIVAAVAVSVFVPGVGAAVMKGAAALKGGAAAAGKKLAAAVLVPMLQKKGMSPQQAEAVSDEVTEVSAGQGALVSADQFADIAAKVIGVKNSGGEIDEDDARPAGPRVPDKSPTAGAVDTAKKYLPFITAGAVLFSLMK